MKAFKKRVLIAFAAATIAGGLLRWLHPAFPNALTAIFSPVNGSVWESMKILFWPLFVVFLFRWKTYRVIDGFPAAIWLVCLMQYVVGFFVHVTLLHPMGFFDIALFVLLMALAFAAAPMFGRAVQGKAAALIAMFTIALGAAMIVFTFLPPDHISFADLAGRNTWLNLPI